MTDVSTNALPTLYLHIGHPKCGSTTIQRFMEHNAASLFKAGFAICNGEGHFVTAGSVGNPPHSWLNSMLDDKKGPALVRERVKGFLTSDAAKGVQSLILSAESLAGQRRASLFTALDDLVSIKVVYYVRRRDEILLSSWKQWQSKRGHSLEAYLERWLRKPVGSFKGTLEEWAPTPGLAEMIVKPLAPEGLVGGDLITDFASIIGVDASTMTRPENANVSFDYDINYMLGQSPEIYDDIHDNSVSNYLEANALDYIEDRGAEILGYEMRARILEKARADHEYVHQHYFPQLGFDKLFGLDGVKPAQRLYNPDGAALAGRSFGLLVKLLEQQSRRIDELEHQLRQLKK